MALDNLRYGNFRPTAVAPESRTLPGFGGQVEEWANFRFQVKAIGKKEQQMTEGERKKLGPLALRLTEGLQGPALQIAKGLGVEALAEQDGLTKLLTAIEEDLLPMKRQTALELYQAGAVQGTLSRQTGEQMSSYILRREAWWSQLRDLDAEVKCSDAILREQMLVQAGLSHLEQQMVRTVLSNDLADRKKLMKTLREQFGSIHEREKNRKGKGDVRRPWNWGKGHSYMVDTYDTPEEPETTFASPDETPYPDEEEDPYGDDEWIEWEEDVSLEEDIVGVVCRSRNPRTDLLSRGPSDAL